MTGNFSSVGNKSLGRIGVALQIFTCSYMVLTTICIKAFCKKTPKQKGKIKKTTSFKNLNLVYGLALIIASIFVFIMMRRKIDCKTFVPPLVGPILLSGMLFLFLITDKEAFNFFRKKSKNFKERREDNSSRKVKKVRRTQIDLEENKMDKIEEHSETPQDLGCTTSTWAKSTHEGPSHKIKQTNKENENEINCSKTKEDISIISVEYCNEK